MRRMELARAVRPLAKVGREGRGRERIFQSGRTRTEKVWGMDKVKRKKKRRDKDEDEQTLSFFVVPTNLNTLLLYCTSYC